MSDSLLSNALGSAAAGIIGRIFTHPLDTAKARVQAVYQESSPGASSSVHRNPYKGPLDVLIRTARTEGMTGLYRGFGAVILGGTPGTVLYLCSYEIAKEQLAQKWESTTNSPMDTNGGDFLVHLTSGMIAETIACIVYVPVDVVKERMQVQHSTGLQTGSAYRNSWDALVQISRTEGLAGIYRGYGATLASFGPFSALYFVFYERLKLWSRQWLTPGTDHTSKSLEQVDLPIGMTVLCSASAGAVASWLTSPLDMAKLRLQVQRGRLASGPSQSVAYRGVLDCLRHSYREGGAAGLFRGAGARVLHFAPATTITITSYETCRSFINRALSSRQP